MGNFSEERMPRYRYVSEDGDEIFKFVPYSQRKDEVEENGKTYKLQMPKNVGSMVMETKDEYRGKKQRKDLNKKLRERMINHHDRYEIAEKIDKHGLNEAEQQGWTKKIKRT